MSLTELTAEEVAAIESNSMWPRFLIGPVGLAAQAALAFYWPSGDVGWQVLWTALTAYIFFCWTSCFHEASHQTICGSRRVSIVIGRAIGSMIFVPYSIYRESHIRHHAYLNKPTDWELWPYSDPKTSLWFRRMFCWLEFPLGVFTTPFAYGRLYFHRDSPLSDPQLRRQIGWEYVAMFTTWVVILTTVALTGSWALFLRAWVIPHWIAGVFQVFRKFTEHLGMKSYDPLLGTRTVIGQKWLTKVACYFNFDIFMHGPHHRHPRASTNQLRDKMTDYQSGNPEITYPVFPTYRAAILDMLPAIWKPGVGMNAGAPPPVPEKVQVENFMVDVTRDVLADSENETVTIS